MPRKGPAFPVTKAWQDAVEARLRELKWNRSELARQTDANPSDITDMLADDAIQTTIMPDVNKALGWPDPRIGLDPESLKLIALLRSLDRLELGKLLGRAESAIQRAREKKH